MFPPPVPQHNLAVEPQRPRSRSRVRWLLVLLAVSLLTGSLAVGFLPRETARWYLAAAWEQQLNGNLEGALQRMDQAIAWDPTGAELYRQRSDWRLGAKDYSGGVEDAERAVELAPNDPANYVQRSDAYQRTGRRREAVEDWNKIVQLAGGEDEIMVKTFTGRAQMNVFNGRAYARALANVELEAGLEDVERAIRKYQPFKDAGLLDTRGYLHYLRGDSAAAWEDLDLAVQLIGTMLSGWKADQADKRRQEVDLRQLESRRKQLEKTAAVLLYHRSLVYDQLQLASQAEADRRRVRQLGHEPTENLF